jgi:hypothetical protein
MLETIESSRSEEIVTTADINIVVPIAGVPGISQASMGANTLRYSTTGIRNPDRRKL